MKSLNCTVENPYMCRIHGMGFAEVRVERAQGAYDRALKKANAPVQDKSVMAAKTIKDAKRLRLLKNELRKAQAKLDAFDENYEKLDKEIIQYVFKTGFNDYQLDFDKKYRDLHNRREDAKEIRKTTRYDASEAGLEAASTFPETKIEATTTLQKNNCGDFVGVIPVDDYKDGTARWLVMGTKGYYTVGETGYMYSVGTMRPILGAPTEPQILVKANDAEPAFLKTVITEWNRGSDVVGYHKLWKRNEDGSNSVAGYELATTRHKIIIDAEGKTKSVQKWMRPAK